ncbi:hypothetical protein RLOC_00005332 [Lonchura striata]|uniref:Uncharacterized protein n=1 Tax=Lonchura striata TaxID=40157 RepID=A0A218UKM1_9PASE|nr:hypothetical protein RLOC_00005332 [Lonchura striata domestica]
MLLITHRRDTSSGLNSTLSRSLGAMQRFTCSVSWWCAGPMIILPGATKAVFKGPREKQALT